MLAEKNMAKYKATLDALPNEQLKKMAQLVAEKKERSEKLQVCRKLIWSLQQFFFSSSKMFGIQTVVTRLLKEGGGASVVQGA